MATSSTPDATEDAQGHNKRRSIDIGRVLGASLPGLGADELASLQSTVYGELELRVGTLLTESLNKSQLDEFEKLVDAGDEAASTRWMNQNLPDHGTTTKVATAALLGQTIAYVDKKIPEALTGDSDVVHVVPVNLDLVQSHFSRKGFKYARDGKVVRTSFGMPDGQPTVNLQISVVERDPALVSLVAVAPEHSYPADARETLLDFANDLNEKSVAVMAYVRGDSDVVRLYASAGLLLPERVTVDSFDSALSAGIFQLMTPFRRLWQLTDGNDDDSSDLTESVVDPDREVTLHG